MGFTSMFLIPFRFGTYVQAMKATLTQQYHAQGEKSKVLLLYGDRDQFTAEADYTNYIKKVTSDTAASLRVKKVPRGDHFFSSKEAFQSMCNAIDDWI
jgi:alpha/beta superfamily hydrolase